MKDFLKECWPLIIIVFAGIYFIYWISTCESPLPTNSQLSLIVKESKSLILTGSDGQKYVATHWAKDKWELHPVK